MRSWHSPGVHGWLGGLCPLSSLSLTQADTPSHFTAHSQLKKKKRRFEYISAPFRAIALEALASLLFLFFMPHSGPGSTNFVFYYSGFVFCSGPSTGPSIDLTNIYIVFGHIPSHVLNCFMCINSFILHNKSMQ